MVNTQDLRLVYLNAMKTGEAAGLKVKQEYMSQAYLRFEVPLNATGTTFNYAILNNQTVQGSNVTGQFPTEQRLKLQDSFFVSHVGFFLKVVSGVVGGVANTSQADILTTFPSAWWVGLGAEQPWRMMRVWEGNLSLTVNKRVVCTQWDLLKHLNRPQTQFPVYAGATPVAYFNYFDQIDGSDYGFYPCEPNWVLIGSKDNELQLTLPEALGTTAVPAGLDVRAVVIVRGILAQNSTVVS